MRMKKPPQICGGFGLFVALEYVVYRLARHLRCEEADNEDHDETADHGYGTAVDGIDGVADEHVDDRQADTPHIAGPDTGRGAPAPVETEHERGEESSCQRTP